MMMASFEAISDVSTNLFSNLTALDALLAYLMSCQLVFDPQNQSVHHHRPHHNFHRFRNCCSMLRHWMDTGNELCYPERRYYQMF